MRPAKTKSNQEAGQTAPEAVFAFDWISPEPKLKSFTSMIPQKKTPESSSRGFLPITPEPAPSLRLWASAQERTLADGFNATATEHSALRA
jgi:hypothetical protein